jgi:predicted  nucleic acid-binding Zn-ribbon protein
VTWVTHPGRLLVVSRLLAQIVNRMGRGVLGVWRRRALALVLAMAAVAGGAARVAAVTDSEIAVAQRKLDAARADAKDAALAYLRAEHELADIEDELAKIEAELPKLRAKVREAHDAFDDNAVALYTGSLGGSDVASGLFSADGAMDVGRITTLASSSTENASTSLDEMRDAQRALEAKEADARERHERQQAVTAELRRQTSLLEIAMRVAGKALRRLQAEKSVQDYFAAVARRTPLDARPRKQRANRASSRRRRPLLPVAAQARPTPTSRRRCRWKTCSAQCRTRSRS